MLDFDGVLNSSASFVMEDRKRRGMRKKKKLEVGPVNETLCHVCTSNFQLILEHFPELKIVISSTWRELYDLEWLKKKLESYGIDSSRVIDKTPKMWCVPRGVEIRIWLEAHPEVTGFAILDDNEIGDGYEQEGKVIKTEWAVGLTLQHVYDTIVLLGGKPRSDLVRN